MTPFFAVGDVVWLAIVAGFFAIITPWFAWKLSVIQKSTKDIHTLVNSKTAVHLKSNWTLADQIVRLQDTPFNREAAKLAKDTYDEHMAQQAIVDDRNVKAQAIST